MMSPLEFNGINATVTLQYRANRLVESADQKPINFCILTSNYYVQVCSGTYVTLGMFWVELTDYYVILTGNAAKVCSYITLKIYPYDLLN